MYTDMFLDVVLYGMEQLTTRNILLGKEMTSFAVTEKGKKVQRNEWWTLQLYRQCIEK